MKKLLKFFLIIILGSNGLMTTDAAMNMAVNPTMLNNNIVKQPTAINNVNKKTVILTPKIIAQNNYFVKNFNNSPMAMLFSIMKINKHIFLPWLITFEPISLSIFFRNISNLFIDFNKDKIPSTQPTEDKKKGLFDPFINFYKDNKTYLNIIGLCLAWFVICAIIRSLCFSKINKSNVAFSSLFFAYTNQPYKYLSDNFSVDSKIINVIAKYSNKILLFFFNNALPKISLLVGFIVNLPNFYVKIVFGLGFIISGIILWPFVIIIKNKYETLLLLSKEYNIKQKEFDNNFKQLKAIGKDNYFFESLDERKKK
jgi:hypothetical protein